MARFADRVMPERAMRTERGRAIARRMSSAFTQVRYRVASDEAAASARNTILAALDRLERELRANGGGHLVGGRFSVADLTAAALFMPLAQPPEGPRPVEMPAALREFREPLLERPGYRWVLDTYARERLPAG